MLSVKDKIIIARYKDTPLRSSKELRKLMNDDTEVNYRDVYSEIVNYQLRKYGKQLDPRYDYLPTNMFKNKLRSVKQSKRRKCPKNRNDIWIDFLGLNENDEKD